MPQPPTAVQRPTVEFSPQPPGYDGYASRTSIEQQAHSMASSNLSSAGQHDTYARATMAEGSLPTTSFHDYGSYAGHPPQTVAHNPSYYGQRYTTHLPYAPPPTPISGTAEGYFPGQTGGSVGYTNLAAYGSSTGTEDKRMPSYTPHSFPSDLPSTSGGSLSNWNALNPTDAGADTTVGRAPAWQADNLSNQWS